MMAEGIRFLVERERGNKLLGLWQADGNRSTIHPEGFNANREALSAKERLSPWCLHHN
jgi:hypothetical protein